MNTYCGVRYSRPAGLFSFGLLNGLRVRLRRPHLREAPADFGLDRLATVFMSNPDYRNARNDVPWLQSNLEEENEGHGSGRAN
jgi:hypothetical protein